jgi:ribosome maturation factor RimP
LKQNYKKIHTAIHRKGGIEKIEKVHQRIGRAKEKYPSVQQYYHIEVSSTKVSRA